MGSAKTCAMTIALATLLTVMVGTNRAVAIPKEEIVRKLEPVTVFTLANAEGNLLIWKNANRQQDGSTAGIFISPKDAQTFLKTFKEKNPDLAGNFQVLPLSLADAYRLSEEGKSSTMHFAYVPAKQQVDSAVSLLMLSGQRVQGFRGTPLFLARIGADLRYLTVVRDNQPVVPLFFEKEQLLELIARYRKEKPEASAVQIQVIDLEGLIATLRSSNDAALTNVVLVTPRESTEYVKALSAGSSPEANPPAPARPPIVQVQSPAPPSVPLKSPPVQPPSKDEGYAPRPDPN